MLSCGPALFERVVGGRMELFLGIERLRAADRGLSDVEFGVVGVGFRSPFDDRSLRHGFEPCREEVRGVEVYILQGLVERRRVFVHLHNIGFGAVEQRLLGGEENGNRFVESGSGRPGRCIGTRAMSGEERICPMRQVLHAAL